MAYLVDQARTARAGETPKNNVVIIGLVAVALATVALSAELYELVLGDVRIGLVAAILAVVSSVAGLGWLNYGQRRARGAQPQVVAPGWRTPRPRPGR
ncbi:hypothetical protein AWC05_25800 [Mycobacterium florentinum]|uniref:UsfY protein n=1 Tax=Mycobacterium florentinum TaxID=292462 RepID=A0A1X1U468_MYCFL|nr:hypothetical protein [Mycobacterium florentinum]MCV7410815.1 hypothetical protein [Mycobacterium florentinum]ORV51607.1 hypothetical protein AWC05_25800 [Mycobacterium florentinum]BBX80149.1 hypothetical protein MFLOJ_39360 [Mycobacterium florentinum]